MLLNLNWKKGLTVWNKIFKFFDDDSDLKKVIQVVNVIKLFFILADAPGLLTNIYTRL
jgi:hypothetical protein